ncbi:PfkB family carbohydrate kinase [Virgisporangium ochraceum]|uniref:PfkB family carbohydrate kinase n=1 Tax=Virgisporangium ochraceum TaxID=65505 RepID=UPI0035A22438
MVVVGDTLLDRDVDGSVERLCPDAPVPVLAEGSVTERAGGAGLAATLAAADGHEVALVTALSDDPAGALLAGLLHAAGVEVHALPLAGATVEKTRLRSDGRTLLRLDRGGGDPSGDPGAATLSTLADADAVLVSDYGQGIARHPALRQALSRFGGPVVWDPHPRGPAAVPGVRLVTPNEDELVTLAGAPGPGVRLAVTARAAHALRERWRVAAVAVTLGSDGALLCHAGPAPLVVATPHGAPPGADTCGAGDRFAAAATAALAAGALVSEAVQEAVARATAYVAAGRPSRTSASGTTVADVVGPVRAAGGTVVATGGCFDLLHTGHLATLRAARALGDCLVVCLNSDRSVRERKGPDRPVTPQADRARLLAALDCVDAVAVFDEPTPEAVLSWLRPDIWVKGGDYSESDLPEADLVRRWGGQTVIVPYLPGRSTTATIARLS